VQPDERKMTFRDLLRSNYGKRLFFVSGFWSCSIIPVFAVCACAWWLFHEAPTS